MFVWWGLLARGLSAHRIPSRPRGRSQHDPLSCYSRATRAALGLEGPSAAAHRARRRGHEGGRRRHGSGHGPRAGGGGRACRRADPDGVRRGRRRAGTSVSTYGSHARIGQTDSVCQCGCGILYACRALIAWLTALVRSRLGGCPVFASAARWSPSRGSPVAERAGKTGKKGDLAMFDFDVAMMIIFIIFVLLKDIRR